MDKLKTAITNLFSKIFDDYQRDGGVITIANVEIAPSVAASYTGVMPALVWLAQKFYSDYKVDFPVVSYKPYAGSQAGYVIDDIQIEGSPASFLLMMTSFMREEVFPKSVVAIDFDVLLTDFASWCNENVMQTRDTLQAMKSNPEGTPE